MDLLHLVLFPLLVEGVQGGDGHTADCGDQQQPDEQLTVDGILHRLCVPLKTQQQQSIKTMQLIN